MIVSTHAANVSLHQSLPYDSIKDIKPITVVTRSPNVLSVHPSEPYKTLGELVAAAKAKPGQLILATSGNGTAQHFAAEHWKLGTGIEMVHVPYRGAGPALNDLVGGQVKIGLLNVASSMPHIQGGRLRPLAVTSLKRNPALPDVPTFSESIPDPDFDFAEWFALAAPGGTPDDIVEKIYAAVKKVAGTPEFAAKVSSGGMVVDLQTPKEFSGFLVAQIDKLGSLVKRANIKLD
jgi:tripartite-type tricarboxylate transporter receptor subunit TctC